MNNKQPAMRSFTGSNFFSPQFLAGIVIFILIGTAAGYFAANMFNSVKSSTVASPEDTSEIVKGKTFGSNDTDTFKDNAEGVLKEGGIEGEGQFHLVRPGGDSQNVYMTSSLVDLSLFIGRKIKVWGQTQTAQKAGWLMDVGKVEVLD